MRTLLDVVDTSAGAGFRRWRDVIVERIVPVELTKVGDRPFAGRLQAADLGLLAITRVDQSAMRTVATASTVRKHGKQDTVTAMLVLAGPVSIDQHGRQSRGHAGDLVVLDRRPLSMASDVKTSTLIMEIPRDRLELTLGPIKSFACLAAPCKQVTTSLAAQFITSFLENHEAVDPATAERLSSVAIDLIVASLAERMAKEPPHQTRATLVYQQALAHIAANALSHSFNPHSLAAHVGTSLRELQKLFCANNQTISACIWQRRLEAAASLLRSQAFAEQPIGVISYRCGFANQAHFSSLFKGVYALTPGDYRRTAGQNGCRLLQIETEP